MGLDERLMELETALPRREKAMCKFYAQGRCKYGEDCRFEHVPIRWSDPDVLPPPSSLGAQIEDTGSDSDLFHEIEDAEEDSDFFLRGEVARVRLHGLKQANMNDKVGDV